MALIKCDECGKEFSEKASVCPHCGAPFEKSKQESISFQEESKIITSLKSYIIVIVFIIFFVWLLSDDDKKSDSTRSEVTNNAPTNEISEEDRATAMQLIQNNGYSCHSITSISRFTDVDGFNVHYNVSCNGYQYRYKIEDQGGNWIVTLE